MIYIETKRLIVRDFTLEDTADLHDILGDAETMEYCEPAYDFEKTQRFLTSFCMDRKGAVAAVHKNSGKMLGYILFNEWENGVYEMGWFLNRNYWRQGYAFEACSAVMEYAFQTRKAHKIFAETIDAAKSLPLMEKLGMRLEGIQRSHVKDIHGSWADLYLYGILEEDWRQLTQDPCPSPR